MQSPDPAHVDLFGGPEPEREIHLADLLDIVRRRWKVGFALGALILPLGLIHYLITPRAYRATTMIQIERRSIMPLSAGQTPWLENWWNMEYYPTQYLLLESRGLAEKVVELLRLWEEPEFNPGWANYANPDQEPGTADVDELVKAQLGQRLPGAMPGADELTSSLVHRARAEQPLLAGIGLQLRRVGEQLGTGHPGRQDRLDHRRPRPRIDCASACSCAAIASSCGVNAKCPPNRFNEPGGYAGCGRICRNSGSGRPRRSHSRG